MAVSYTPLDVYKRQAMAEVLFQPMIDWVLDAVQNAGIQSTCTVAAHCEALASHLEGRGETILLGLSLIHISSMFTCSLRATRTCASSSAAKAQTLRR